jgi:hypothetical protein
LAAVAFIDTDMFRCLASLLVVVAHSCCWVQGVVVERSDNGPALRRHRATQAKVGTIAKVRWIDSNTDQPNPLFFRDLVNGDILWVERDDFDPSLTLDAVTEGGPVGSVRLELFSQINRLENFAPWALCGNNGPDFFACNPKIVTPDSGDLIVTPYSEKYGKGTAGEPFRAFIVIYTAQACDLFFRGVNADTDQVDGDRIDGGSNYVVNVTSTPRINFLLDWELLSRCWEPVSVSFSYDMGAKTTFDDKRPFSAFGDVTTTSGSIDYLPYTPTIGTHSLNATIYKRPGLVGTTLALTITVVK